MVERASRRRRLADEVGRPVWKLFGSLKHGARRLLERVRLVVGAARRFDPGPRGKLRIGLDRSEATARSVLRVSERMPLVDRVKLWAAEAGRGARRAEPSPPLSGVDRPWSRPFLNADSRVAVLTMGHFGCNILSTS